LLDKQIPSFMTEDEAIAAITANLQHYVDGDLTTQIQ